MRQSHASTAVLQQPFIARGLPFALLLVLTLVCLLPAPRAQAQDDTPAPDSTEQDATALQSGVVSPLQNGVLETVMQDDGYLVISGSRFTWREADARISYRGRPLRSSLLAAGQRVSYRTRSDGSLAELSVSAPDAALDRIDQQ